MTETYIEKRKRGFFGWIFLLLFIAWNLLMLLWLVGAMNSGPDTSQMSEAQRTSAALGTGLGVVIILVIWALGSVVTGLLALLTRGSKTIVKKVA